MRLNFLKTGIALGIDFTGAVIKELPGEMFIISHPEDKRKYLIIKEARISKRHKLNDKFKQNGDLWLARWNKFEKDVFKEYLIIKNAEQSAVFIEAISLSSKSWATKSLNNIKNSISTINPAERIKYQKNPLIFNTFKCSFGGQKRCYAEIWIKGEPNNLFVRGLQLILFVDEKPIKQLFFSSDVLLKNSCVIRDELMRVPFLNIVDKGECYFFCYTGLLEVESDPDEIEVRVAALTLNGWEKANYVTRKKMKTVKYSALNSPVNAADFIGINGPQSQNQHLDSVVKSNNGFVFPQQFAVDLVHEKDLLKNSQARKNDDYYGYGKSVCAVEKGIVVDFMDGIPDNKPGKFNLRQSAGNYVVIKHKQFVYSFYAHLKTHSLTVKKGQKIDALQPIAEVGNSGNSSMPHLHFQLSISDLPLSSESIPFLFNKTGWPSDT